MRRRPFVAPLGVALVVLGSLIGLQASAPPADAPGTTPGVSSAASSAKHLASGPAELPASSLLAEGAAASPEHPTDPTDEDSVDSGAPTERGHGLPRVGETGRPDGEFGPPSDPALTEQERTDRLAGILGEDVTDGEGTLLILPGEEEAPDPDAGRVIDVRIEVEDGLPVDDEAFGAFVMETLNDERSWPATENVSFARTDGDTEFRVVLASPDLVDELCAPLRTVGQYSCGRNGHAALNSLRWLQGAQGYLDAGGELIDYRRYLVNHEVGHLLGYPHEGCPAPGEPAPIMVQQSIDLDGCAPSAWVEE